MQRQNILNFLNDLQIRNKSFESLIQATKEPRLITRYKYPHISLEQLKEYETNKFREALNFLDRHPEIKGDVIEHIDDVQKNGYEFTEDNIPDEILVFSRLYYPNLRNEVDQIYRGLAYNFLVNNYSLFQPIRLHFFPFQYE